jgi:hypothetical protein
VSLQENKFRTYNFAIMLKPKKKSAKEASDTFHKVMQASVSNNPKPKTKKGKTKK